jgi:hypothetical protein
MGMFMKSSQTFCAIGPLVPTATISQFSKIDNEIIELAWQIVGPSVEKNLNSFKPIHLWKIFAACYAEGVQHGLQLAKERES